MVPKNSKQRKSLYPNLRLDPVDFSYSDKTNKNEEFFFDGPAALRPEADIHLEEESSQDKYKPRKKGIQEVGEGIRDFGYQGNETSYGPVVKIWKLGKGYRAVVKPAENFYLHVKGASLEPKQIQNLIRLNKLRRKNAFSSGCVFEILPLIKISTTSSSTKKNST